MKSKIMNMTKEELSLALQNKKSWRDILRDINVIVNGNNLVVLKQRLKEFELEFTPISRNPLLKTDIFEKIDCKEKAYWIGFLMADGYVTDRKIVLRLSIKDEEQVIRFVNFIGGETNNIRRFIDPNGYSMIEFNVTNYKMTSDLNKLGCKSPKAKSLKLLTFHKEVYTLAFLMGFYDGDGQEHNASVCSGSLYFLSEIKKKYKLTSKIRLLINNWGRCYELSLGKVFLKELMINYPDSMNRKRKQVFGYKFCQCGTPLMNKVSVECRKCVQVKNKKIILTKKELELMLTNSSLRKTAIKLGVALSSLKRQCIRLNIDYNKLIKYRNNK